jgi:hypothetical protein
MEKDSTLTTESYINAYYIVSSAASNPKFPKPGKLSENGYDDGNLHG